MGLILWFKEKFADDTPLIERWALKNANITTPDEIIAAAIVQSFTKDFDKWQDQGFSDPYKAWGYSQFGKLINAEKGITISRKPERKFNPNGLDKFRFNGMTVNDAEVSAWAEKFIAMSWEKIAAKVVAAQEAAEKAKASMNKNEQAWNLAEKLLNMKRDENGALVPVQEAE